MRRIGGVERRGELIGWSEAEEKLDGEERRGIYGELKGKKERSGKRRTVIGWRGQEKEL